MRLNYCYCIDDVDAIIADQIQPKLRDADGLQLSIAQQQPPNENREQHERTALVNPRKARRA